MSRIKSWIEAKELRRKARNVLCRYITMTRGAARIFLRGGG